MPRPKTQSERNKIISRIIELVKKHGRITTKEVVAMFDLHRTTAEKYIRISIARGELIRYGRCGIFRDQRTIIDFDLKRFSHTRK
ncbi:UNVERIFIED_ORG: DeoR/GlpR family transcriptional regulator of sugar metabolism [Enterobacter mori]|jgi:DeoR/GlpR family transcriptional regulator of sugar metabolism|nr:DeoR/GlpR family transcriptional regulator of sugar metabolism [Enterobacter mori]MDP9658153.1 DeoR/GlpR family transcriptional regulator of sugar metabolism [Enterobacter mori]